MNSRRENVVMQAGEFIVQQSSDEKLLGGTVSNDLKWKKHLLFSDQSVVKQLATRLSGLAMISRRSDFKSRLMIANGIFMSKICYLIQVWGGCENYLLDVLQKQQNKAARAVTNRSQYTPIRRLLTECNWLSIRQLVFYHSVILIHKAILTGYPKFMKDNVSSSYPYRTRQESNGLIRLTKNCSFKSALARNSFMFRGINQYNQLPSEIRTSAKLEDFKFKAKMWIKENIEI